jgi:hypothetical protein
MAKKNQYKPNKRRSREVLGIMDAALNGGADALLMAIHEEFASRSYGYTTGDFETETAVKSNEVTLPYTKRGRRRILVQNVANRDNRPYPVFWEFGWQGRNGQFNISPLYEPAMMRAMPAVLPSAVRQIQRGRTDVGTLTTRGAIEVSIP